MITVLLITMGIMCATISILAYKILRLKSELHENISNDSPELYEGKVQLRQDDTIYLVGCDPNYMGIDKLTVKNGRNILWAYQCVKHDATSAVFYDEVVIARRDYIDNRNREGEKDEGSI